ncbi:MAG TPA: glycine zipper 2TM domain-containing protein [Burkholderiales bacterium]|nr:glycine zipper 2TM domain-containing protein [Burkholderiales bacterium]
MKKLSALIAIPVWIAGGNAHAFEAIANVISVSPVTEMVNRPSQQCWTETRQTTHYSEPDRNYAGAILGGVAGGLLGATVGRGNGRIAAAAVGAGVGALTGDRIANQDARTPYTTAAPVQRCRQVDNFQPVTTGYLVTYEYNGQRYTARMPYNPGSQVRVNVAVTPR